MSSRARRFWFSLATLSLLAGLAPAVRATTATITAVTYTGGAYVIDSDASNGSAGYDRDRIPMSVTVDLTGTAFTETVANFRVRFRLLDDAGAVVPLLSGTEYSNVVSWPSGFGAGTGMPFPGTVTFTGRIDPTTQLDVQKTYHVEAQVQRSTLIYANLGSAVSSVARRFYHFTNTTAGDAARNVITTLGNCDFSQAFSIAGSAAQDGFWIDAPYTVRRYDNYTAGSPTDATSTRMVFEVHLFRENGVTDVEVPLIADNSWEFNTNIPYWVTGSPRAPYSDTRTGQLKLRPKNQLDSRETYYAVVSVSHREVDSPETIVFDETETTPTRRLLDFNGRLDFGAIQTQIVQVTGDPAAGATLTLPFPYASVSCNIAVVQGRLAAPSTGHTFGDGTALAVRLMPDGRAVYVGGATVSVTPPPPGAPDRGSVAGIDFLRGPVGLSTGGASGTVYVMVPAGMTLTSDADGKFAAPYFSVGTTALGQNLAPLAATLAYSPSSTVWVAEETKPVQIETSTITWALAAGQLQLTTTGNVAYTEAPEIAKLNAAPLPTAAKTKRSNERYFATVSGLLTPGATIAPAAAGDRSAHLTASFTLGGGTFFTHFPYGTTVSYTSGRVTVVADAIDPAVASSRLSGVTTVTTKYEQACHGEGCSGAVDHAETFTLSPTSSRLLMTADGGLIAAGAFSAANQNDVRLGFITGTQFAHETRSKFTLGTFHASGHFLRGGPALTNASRAPGIVHLSGFFASDPTLAPERPNPGIVSTADPYLDGFADYAGINLRVGVEPASPTFKGRSRLAGSLTPEYNLKARTKYYLRPVGATGVLDVNGSPGAFPLYGFPVVFDNFSLAFRDGRNVDSATEGELTVPHPSNFAQRFEKLSFTCLGDLKEAELPEDNPLKRLDYWNAEFRPSTLEFRKADVCSPGGAAILVMAIEARAHHLNDVLAGEVGWYSSGRIVPLSDPTYDVRSRFPLPSGTTLAGPGGESYAMTPVSEAYFNSYDDFPSTTVDQGFIAFAARLDVAFFPDLPVQVHTFAKAFNPPAGSPPSRLHLMGGWKDGSKTFFNATDFDAAHRGYPPDALPTPDVSLAQYRNEAPSLLPAPTPVAADDPYRNYRIYAKRTLLDIVDLEYPIQFNSGARIWTSSAPQSTDILVLNVQHQLDLLTPSLADITFGASLAGLPSLSLSNAACSFTDEISGAPAGGLQNVVGSVVNVGTLNQGFAALNGLLADGLDLAVNDFVATSAVQTEIGQLYTAINGAYVPGDPVSDAVITGSIDDLTALISNASTSATTTFLARVRAQVSASLQQTINAIDVLASSSSQSPAARGLFAPDGSGRYNVTEALVKQLILQGSPEAGALAAQIAGPLLDAKISELTSRGAPAVAEVRAALLAVQSQLVLLRNQANSSGGELTQRLAAIVAAATDQIALQPGSVGDRVEDAVKSITHSPAQLALYFGDYNQSVFTEQVTGALRSALLGRQFASDLNAALRQYLYDLDAQLRTVTDSGFQLANGTVRRVLAEALEDISPSFTGALGDVSSSMKFASVDGYARLNGDSLRTLRLDLKAKLDLLAELKADAYLQIDVRDSSGDEACSWGAPGSYITEVKLGADNVETDWLGEMRLNVGVKFSFADTGALLGAGGSIELAEGKAKFEKFGITEFGATAMFGALENYVGARARAEFNHKAIKVGFFFGRTCSKEPLELVDSDVASILGKPPFTGGYVYGEASYPVNELLGIPSSCMLNITGTVGAGIWVFAEGPDFGGKLYFKVTGEVACVAEIGGEITLLGGKSGNDFVLKGRGRLWVEVCFLFCFEGEATVRAQCRNSDCDWDVDI